MFLNFILKDENLISIFTPNNMKYKITLLFLFIHFGVCTTPDVIFNKSKYPPFLQHLNSKWVNNVLDTLTLKQKIAQLIIVPAYSNNKKSKEEVELLINNNNIGGVIFFQGGPVRQAHLTNYFQKISSIPLLVTQDAEWGLSMRLDSTHAYPWAMTMGAVNDNNLVYNMASDLASHCNKLRVNINFGPVADVNSNPKNPIINSRSFGENKYDVSEKTIKYISGLQDNNVLACAKHFPGHGDTDSDSHKTLPFINHSKTRIDEIELYPFKKAIENGVGSIMVAHLEVPAFETQKNLPSSLSKKIVSELLKKDLGFQGLAITDALNMKGVANYFTPQQAALQAFIAGNDILLMPDKIKEVIDLIAIEVSESRILKKQLDFSCRKILALKNWSSLNKYQAINTINLHNDLNQVESKILNKEIASNAITVLKNDNLIPLNSSQKIAYIELGGEEGNTFFNHLNYYSEVEKITPNFENLNITFNELEKFDIVIAGVHKSSKSPWKSYSVSRFDNNFIEKVSQQNKLVLILFCNPYSLLDFPAAEKAKSLILSYQNDDYFQSLSAQLIFGAISANGKLPVSVSPNLLEGHKLTTPRINKFQISLPEEQKMNTTTLNKIDSIVFDAINDKAMPGCQVFISKNGNVIFNKSYGYQTYEGNKKITKKSLYDLASLTKILATMPCLMYLDEHGKFSLNEQLSTYLSELSKTNKSKLSIKDVLAHQAGLKSWIPFYREILDSNWADMFLKPTYSNEFSIQISDNLYLHRNYLDTIYSRLDSSEVSFNKEYLYSDLGYYYLKKVIENLLGEPMDEWLLNNVYKPLGTYSLGYLPMKRFNKNDIVPTEYDNEFRQQLVHGYVHDPGAAMLGGVGSHAGLFGNAFDVGVIMQMYLQGGTYGNKKYVDSDVLNNYTKCQFCKNNNRRGAGFDKPQLEEEGPTCGCVSLDSFGHTGFTGTIAWADPKEQIVYVFLSNRIYPTVENKKLIEKDVRTKIQQTIYNSIIK